MVLNLFSRDKIRRHSLIMNSYLNGFDFYQINGTSEFSRYKNSQ